MLWLCLTSFMLLWAWQWCIYLSLCLLLLVCFFYWIIRALGRTWPKPWMSKKCHCKANNYLLMPQRSDMDSHKHWAMQSHQARLLWSCGRTLTPCGQWGRIAWVGCSHIDRLLVGCLKLTSEFLNGQACSCSPFKGLQEYKKRKGRGTSLWGYRLKLINYCNSLGRY